MFGETLYSAVKLLRVHAKVSPEEVIDTPIHIRRFTGALPLITDLCHNSPISSCLTEIKALSVLMILKNRETVERADLETF